MVKFKLTKEQNKTAKRWLKEQRDLELQEQIDTIGPDNPSYKLYLECWEMGHPYTGTIGGRETYMFTPTSIGCVVAIKYKDKSIDITDYDSW